MYIEQKFLTAHILNEFIYFAIKRVCEHILIGKNLTWAQKA